MSRNGPSALALRLALGRIRMSSAVALSALVGYILSPTAAPDLRAAAVTGGIFLLAAGGSVLNQVQERDLDALMERTRRRPLPSRQMSASRAGIEAALMLICGLALLAWLPAPQPALLGGAAIGCYNGLYTPLKRKTCFALLPGALCGSLPPLIGWAAAGGDLTDVRIITLCGLFALWQVPHFWMLALRHRDDYRQAGIPTLPALLHDRALLRLSAVWALALAASSLLLLTHQPLEPFALRGLFLPLLLWFLYQPLKILSLPLPRSPITALGGKINLYMTGLLWLILLNKVIP